MCIRVYASLCVCVCVCVCVSDIWMIGDHIASGNRKEESRR